MSPARMSLGLNSTTNTAGQVVCVTRRSRLRARESLRYDSISPAAAAFISPARSSSDLFERTVAGASLAGEFLSLPAGAISAAIGVEYRSDHYEFMPGATDLAREYGSASRGITRRTVFDVSEVFAEVRVPTAFRKPFADVLAIEGAMRYSDYSNFGSTDTWRAGLEWGPVEWLRFRGAYNVAIRAPAINELFAPITRRILSRQRSLRGHPQSERRRSGISASNRACRRPRSTPSCRRPWDSASCRVAIPALIEEIVGDHDRRVRSSSCHSSNASTSPSTTFRSRSRTRWPR